MALTFIQYLAFFFIIGWITGDVLSFSHIEKLCLGLLGTSIGFIVYGGFKRTKDAIKTFLKS